MHIREAILEDNAELKELQAKCPQGTTLMVSNVNTPDFFARAKGYESYKVFVACEGDRIIGSGACAIRNGRVNGDLCRIGYEFQVFTSPKHRNKGVARELLQHIEEYLTQNHAVLSYSLIMEDNLPSMKLVESQGFKPHRTLVMPVLLSYKEMDVPSVEKIRQITLSDLAPVADLLNDTWEGHDFFEPVSAETLAQFINRTPAYSIDNLFIMEDQGQILACLGYWDWSQIMRITVLADNLPLNIRMRSLILNIARKFKPMPRVPRAGDTLKQWMLSPLAFRTADHLSALLRYVNNRARIKGIEQIMCVCEQNHELLRSMKGLFRRDVMIHLYIKPLRKMAIGDNPVFLDGIDL